MDRKTVIFCATLIACDLAAQITPIGTVESDQSWPTRLSRSLTTAGPKYVAVSSTGFDLYNLDTTPYQNVVYPAPPAGFDWAWYGVCYITEDLFDTDPSTIEFLLYANANDGTEQRATAVVREDGTVVFVAFGEGITGGGGADEFISSPWIFNTPQGAILTLLDTTGLMHTYQLPGLLPCVECDGSLSASMLMLGDGPDEVVVPSGMTVFPNPASASSEVVFGTGSDIHACALLLIDASGAVVKRLLVPNGADRMTVSVAEVAAGVYSYRLDTDRGIVPGTRLIVVR